MINGKSRGRRQEKNGKRSAQSSRRAEARAGWERKRHGLKHETQKMRRKGERRHALECTAAVGAFVASAPETPR